MTRKSSASKKQEVAEAQKGNESLVTAAPGLFVLKKNHGLTIHGRAHKFYAAGTTFDPAKDGDLISHLVRSGAHIEETVAEAEIAEEPDAEEQPEGDTTGKPE